MCAVLGWSLDAVLSLTWPQWEYISCQLCRIQYNRAKNEVRFGVCASISAGAAEVLDRSAGDYFFDDAPKLTYTDEELKIAEARMDEINRQREKEEGENV